MEDTENILKALSNKIPQDKLIVVPILLLMINTKTWKFPEEFRTSEFQEIVNVIENCEELKETFGTKGTNIT